MSLHTERGSALGCASISIEEPEDPTRFHNHPATSLMWYMRPLDWNTQGGRRRFSCGYKDRYDFSHQEQNSVSADLPFGNAIDPIVTASLTLNGHLRWPQDMKSSYFRVMTPWTSWRSMPSTNIYTYSFALQAADWQPTSTKGHRLSSGARRRGTGSNGSVRTH